MSQLPRSASYGAADAVEEEKGWRLERRHAVAILAFFGFANIYAMRANLSVAIVEMTSGTDNERNGTITHIDGEFSEWTPMIQGVVLGSFFYGYIITQIPGGFLAHRYGGKLVFVGGVAGTAFFTLLTPPFAKMGYMMIIFARFMEGLLEGVTYPAMHVVWSHWAPILEKTKLATFAFSGSYFGTVVAMPLSAFFGQHFGWPMIFYFFGLAGLLWCYIWWKQVAETPSNDLKITTDELTLLQRDAVNTNTYIVPWRLILRSKPVWAIVIAHTCQNWGFYTMLTNLPRVLKDLAEYQLEKAGFVAGLPYLVMGFLLIWAGQFSDHLRKERGMTTVRVRKFFGVVGFLGQAVTLIAASLASSSTWLVGWITLSMGFGGFTWAAFSVNHLDLAPQYAGHLMALSNTIATLPGMISPLIVGAVVVDASVAQWNVIFYITTVIYLIGAFMYARWASGEIEPWASDHMPFASELQ
ncbi:unnamed protein product, partial [Mesorhabditis belari]|uniref:Sialin n=1 Tax=Mesorhabditis belari TaxID=2138241 RepID=A0AAF3EGT6_9BILA